jgi:hypothetical protein
MAGPHVVPTSFRVNDDGTVDIGGHDFTGGKKWRDVAHNPWVGLVVDDVHPPWRPASSRSQDEPNAARPGEQIWARGSTRRTCTSWSRRSRAAGSSDPGDGRTPPWETNNEEPGADDVPLEDP